jgi:hypothetical protein
MRTSPSIVPEGADQDTYLVLDDFGRIGCFWRETDAESADRETLIRDLVDGQYRKPVRIWSSTPPRAGPVRENGHRCRELRRRYVEFGFLASGAMIQPTPRGPLEYKPGLDRAITRGWLVMHESGSFVRFTQAGADLFT